MSQRRQGVTFHSSADAFLEVVTEMQYWHHWQTEPVWMDKPAACIKGVSAWQCLITTQVPHSHWAMLHNQTKVSHCNCLCQLIWGKKYCSCTLRSVCHLQKTLTRRVFVLKKKLQRRQTAPSLPCPLFGGSSQKLAIKILEQWGTNMLIQIQSLVHSDT